MRGVPIHLSAGRLLSRSVASVAAALSRRSPGRRLRQIETWSPLRKHALKIGLWCQARLVESMKLPEFSLL